MSKRASPSSRPSGRAAPKPPGRAKRPRGSTIRSTRWLLPAILAALVFAAAFVLDTTALLKLFWFSLTGHLGLVARLLAAAVVLVCAIPVVAKIYPYFANPPAPPPKARTRKSPSRRDPAVKKPPAAEGGPAPVKRRARAEPVAETVADTQPSSQQRKAKRPAPAQQQDVEQPVADRGAWNA